MIPDRNEEFERARASGGSTTMEGGGNPHHIWEKRTRHCTIFDYIQTYSTRVQLAMEFRLVFLNSVCKTIYVAVWHPEKKSGPGFDGCLVVQQLSACPSFDAARIGRATVTHGASYSLPSSFLRDTVTT